MTFAGFGGIVHLMKNIEQDAPSQEHKRSGIKAGWLAWPLGAAATALSCGLVVVNIDVLDKQPVAPISKNIDTNVGSVTILDGARLYSEPVTGLAYGTNVLAKLQLEGVSKTINIPTPDGVLKAYGLGGEMLGIPVDDLPEKIQAEAEDDPDGTVWVDGRYTVQNLIK